MVARSKTLSLPIDRALLVVGRDLRVPDMLHDITFN